MAGGGSGPAAGDPASSPAAAGLYIHVPWCRRVCPYCDFAVARGTAAERSAWVRDLEREFGLWSGEGFAFDTVYLGGGTPSTLEPDDLARILDACRRDLWVPGTARLYLEANPEDADPGRLRAWRSLGFRTVSLGVQSFDAGELRRLGRRHDPERARRSVDGCREAGFDTVSVDLIYGLPGQDAAAWRRSLEALVRLAPDHASCYQLTFHEGTPYGRGLRKGVYAELPEEAQAELFELTHALLADAGYEGYEVSNFAREPRHRSAHNLKYWDHTPYLGLGPSAHSFRGEERWWNERAVADWRRRLDASERPVAGRERLGAADLALEAAMLRLRTRDGIRLAAYRQRYGVDLVTRNRPRIERLVEDGLATLEGDRLAPTVRGMAVADAIARNLDLEPDRNR